MLMDKVNFLKNEFISSLNTIDPEVKSLWGTLSLQGMVEHMTDSIGIGWRRIQFPLQYSEEITNKSRIFMLSDKPFKPGTKNSLMSEVPEVLRCKNLEEAKEELKNEIGQFFTFWANNPDGKVLNPFFGELSYQEWVHLLHKHATHHLKQFDVE